ncbi:MAG: PDZ domain-containing protein [Pyrinomonadaceae bacterium]
MELRLQNTIRIALLAGLFMTFGAEALAQVATTPPPPRTPQAATSTKPRTVRRPAGPVVVEARAVAPQVVTILHRLNGLKMFRLLMRSGEEIGAITRLDEAFRMKDEVHTSVIAGLAMDDGETIAARLPEAAAELDPAIAPEAPPAPQAPSSPLAFPGVRGTPSALAGPGLLAGAANLFDRPDVIVIGRDGKRLVAHYVGLDGVTGLSVLKLVGHHVLGAVTTRDLTVVVGQRLRLLGPEPVAQSDSRTAGTIYVRIGETEAKVVSVTNSPSGATARIRIRSTNLSPANIGGVAINDAGQTVGIVETAEKNEATLLPNALIRGAARRVLERQASVPRPWLGIRGEAMGSLALEQIMRVGWQAEKARSLVQQQRGILLTSVAPGSPAAGAALQPGDVILRVNEGEVKSADDFSWLLEEVGAGNSVNFTVARPGKTITEAVEVTLSEAPVAFYGSTEDETEGTEVNIERVLRSGDQTVSPISIAAMLLGQGVETIGVKPPVASRFGAGSGLLVIYVNPQTLAFKAGLRSGDVIEAINGHPVLADAIKLTDPGSGYSLNVVRNKEKLVVKITRSSQ